LCDAIRIMAIEKILKEFDKNTWQSEINML
jgi:hypothetical protein